MFRIKEWKGEKVHTSRQPRGPRGGVGEVTRHRTLNHSRNTSLIK